MRYSALNRFVSFYNNKPKTPIEYSVYSISHDLRDDGGIEQKHSMSFGDCTLSAAPLEFRALPDIMEDNGDPNIFLGKERLRRIMMNRIG